VVGYVSDSLPDAVLTQFDCACIVKLSELKWVQWSTNGPVSTLMRQSTNSFLALAGIENPGPRDLSPGADEKRRLARERRSKGIEKLILALSDQQLVAGLAILIAAYIGRCSMTLYHFYIVVSFAWFSSTVHLSTLAVLRVYLINHPRVRDWRFATMLSVYGLLSVSLELHRKTARYLSSVH